MHSGTVWPRDSVRNAEIIPWETTSSSHFGFCRWATPALADVGFSVYVDSSCPIVFSLPSDSARAMVSPLEISICASIAWERACAMRRACHRLRAVTNPCWAGSSETYGRTCDPRLLNVVHNHVSTAYGGQQGMAEDRLLPSLRPNVSSFFIQQYIFNLHSFTVARCDRFKPSQQIMLHTNLIR